jgi:hypothetical protein
MTNVSGVFEIPEENYKQLVKLYAMIQNVSSDSFEEFCGKMVLEGTIQLSKRFIELENGRN